MSENPDAEMMSKEMSAHVEIDGILEVGFTKTPVCSNDTNRLLMGMVGTRLLGPVPPRRH